ncbi:helix-turn-helix transcriptional regulator [Herbidospora daliensis]|uniref:helix-turn-helix transcriptional regulator n=1 Tax=Herbidospora daliensis TaxID=295585 RepID=UPI000781D8BF|nr:LuxR family transcriptional regulator [Herbidospora daliensis]
MFELLGREDEQRRLHQLLASARNGRGGSSLITGEPGIGKTALLESVTAGPTGLTLFRLDGFESEMALPFAAVHRLTIPLSAYLPSLSGRHREAIRVASGLAEGPPPDRFLVGLGVLGLFAAAAAANPVVCAVDDAHLLDQESLDVMAFVARRIAVEPVALLFTARDEQGVAARLAGVPELPLQGLAQEPATALLLRSLSAPIDPASAAAVARASGGNPLALIDLAEQARDLTCLGLSATTPMPVGRRLEAYYADRVAQADPQVRQWALLAAADTTSTLGLIDSAARTLGLGEDVADRADAAGLIELRDSVRFRHPLVRSAVYNAASSADRRRAHRALARAADDLGMVEQESWHSAKATLGIDATVADRLEHSADLAARRGGLASRASILTMAADLTPPGPVRDARLAGAAEAALAVGAVQTAGELLTRIDVAAADPVSRGRVLVVRHALGLFAADPAVLRSATAGLVEAADAFHGHDLEREQRTLLKAFEFCATTDRLTPDAVRRELGARIETGAASGGGPAATILAGLGALMSRPHTEAVPLVRAAFDALLALPGDELMHMGSAIAALGTYLWDDAGRRAGLSRAAEAAREAGALQALDTLLWVTSLAELTGGTVRHAQEAMEHVREGRLAMGYDAEHVANAALMAWTGAPREVVQAIADGADAVGFGGVGASAVHALALRDLSEGNYRDAHTRLKPLIADPFFQVTPTQYADFVEAAVRSGHPGEARPLVALLRESAEATGSSWCRGVATRAEALTSDDDTAEAGFTASLRALAPTCAQIDLARTHLLYGEWLRRMRRRREAGEQLQHAVALFEQSGAHLFIPRARTGLEAVGLKPAAAADPGTCELTPQEFTIARLAALGHTNPEIATALFISVNTVDYHLRKIFKRLGVSSRRQLVDKLKIAVT